ncbi:MAG TPA: hypothetical protein V6D46_06460 [Coleofasciculaceae cyanobacterium]
MISLSYDPFPLADYRDPSPVASVFQLDPPPLDAIDPDSPLGRVLGGQVWIINNRRRNGLLLIKGFYAEFAGPGAAVGGPVDRDCCAVIPLGDFELLRPTSLKERETGYRIRLQWLKLVERFAARGDARQRARRLLDQFEEFFDRAEIEALPDSVLAATVGVLPHSLQRARHKR